MTTCAVTDALRSLLEAMTTHLALGRLCPACRNGRGDHHDAGCAYVEIRNEMQLASTRESLREDLDRLNRLTSAIGVECDREQWCILCHVICDFGHDEDCPYLLARNVAERGTQCTSESFR